MSCECAKTERGERLALVSGNMKLRGDLRLFLRMNTLFSVDAKPRGLSEL